MIPRIIGHRGAAAAAPENTLESLREAKRQGASWVEVDVKLTSDNALILLHDDLVDRTTNGKGAAAGMTFAALRALDAGAWKGDQWTGALIPTLEEAVKEIRALHLNCNFEIKPCPGRDAETAELAMRALQKLWPAETPTPLISSFSYEALRVAHQIAPELPRAVLVEEVPANWLALCEGVDAVALNPWHQKLTPEQVATIKAAGYDIASYTVNETARARELFKWGVDAVFTDAPGKLLSELGSGFLPPLRGKDAEA